MKPATREGICNLALAKIRAKPIATFDEESLEARECRRFYPEVIGAMLEGPEDWVFAVQRKKLAGKPNDRPDEWTLAYQVPSNMAHAIRVLPDLTALGLSLPVTVSNDPYMETWATVAVNLAVPYEIVGETLYCNATGATIEYRIDDIEGAIIPKLVGQALAVELGRHLAVPVKGDSNREKELLNEVEVAWERAIAENRNRQPARTDYESETLAARRGLSG